MSRSESDEYVVSGTVDKDGAYPPGEPGGDEPAMEDDVEESPPTTDGEKCTFLTGTTAGIPSGCRPSPMPEGGSGSVTPSGVSGVASVSATVQLFCLLMDWLPAVDHESSCVSGSGSGSTSGPSSIFFTGTSFRRDVALALGLSLIPPISSVVRYRSSVPGVPTVLHIPGVTTPSSSRLRLRCPPNERGDGVLGVTLSACDEKPFSGKLDVNDRIGSGGLPSETVGGKGTSAPVMGLGSSECMCCTAGLGTRLVPGLQADMEGAMSGGGSYVPGCGRGTTGSVFASPGIGLRPSRKAFARSAAFHFA